MLELINGQLVQVNNKFGPGSVKVSIVEMGVTVACVSGWRTWIEYISA